MKVRKIIATAAAAGLVSAGAYAQQSPADLQRAAEQAMQAAQQAMKAAQQAQAAAEQAQAALAKTQQAVTQAAAPATPAGGKVTGLTYQNGANSLTLYGLIDVTLSHANNANAAGQSLTGTRTAWFSGNRWGLTGKHDLGTGDGLKAIFRLESEFENQTGNMDTPGVLFNRDAWLGFESDSLGKLTFGRQNALARDPAASAVYGDPYGSATANLSEGGYSNNNNFKQLIFYAGSATGTRYDRGIVWKKKIGNAVAGLAYQFGNVPGNMGTGATGTGSLAYNGANYTVAGFATSANVAGLTNRTYSIGGNFRPNSLVRLNAGYFHYTAEQPLVIGNRTDNAWTASAKFTPKGKMDYEVGYQVMSASNAAVNGGGFVVNAYSDVSGATAAATGKRKTFYASTFYHVDKSMELYLAFDHLNTTGGYLASQANGFTSQNEVGLGMRYKF